MKFGSLLSSSIVAIATTFPVSAYAQQQTYEFKIQAQPLDGALRAFARTSRQQVLFDGELVKGKQSSGYIGTAGAKTAVQAILAGTGLNFRISGRGAFVITGKTIAANSALEESSSALGEVPLSAGEAVSPSGGNAARSDAADDEDAGAEIVVTGTNIRGAQNPTVPLERFNREDIDRSAATTTQDFIRKLPQNYRGGEAGASEDGALGPTGGGNLESASGANLRGLGTSSTLVLINGHRIAPSAGGQIVDVSIIPLSAIDRVDVLTDGASAIYGADAVGGVINFVLRSEYEGAETTGRVGNVTSGGRQEYAIGQFAGLGWSTGNVMAGVQFSKFTPLRTDQRSLTNEIASPTDLYPETEQYSALLSARQSLGGSVTASADLLYSRRNVDRRFTSAGLRLDDHVRADNFSAAADVSAGVVGDWRITASGIYSFADTVNSQVREPDEPGYVDGEPFRVGRFDLYEAMLKADGTLFEIPGGSVKLALGASYRHERYTTSLPWAGSNREAASGIKSAFGEALIPLVGGGNARPFLRELTLSVAGRFDSYSNYGDRLNPKVGIFWSPAVGIGFRAAFSTSFRVPNATEVGNAGFGFLGPIVYFAQPDGVDRATLYYGNISGIEPERSKNLTIGASIEPSFASGLRLTANYFDIRYNNRIITPPFDASVLLRPEQFGSLITTFANDQAAQAFVDQAVAGGAFYSDPDGTGISGIRYAYNVGLVNAATVHTQGLDLGASYDIEGNRDRFNLSANVTLLTKLDSAFCGGCTAVNLSNTFGQPLKFRGRAQAAWSRDALQLAIAINHANGYSDTTTVPASRLGAFTTVDFSAQYGPTWLPGFDAILSVSNLFNEMPSKTSNSFGAVGNLGYDAFNADVLGRFVSLQLRKRW